MARYVIVGNGVAGVRAAEAIRETDPKGEIVILGGESHPFYRRPQLADYASGRTDDSAIWGKPDDFYKDTQIDVRTGTRVVGIDARRHRLTLEGGATEQYDRLLLATGARPAPPPWEGAPADGVISLYHLDDANWIKANAVKGETAVVVGENSIALETARALRESGMQVKHMLRGERLWPEMLDEEAGQIVQDHLKGRGIEFVRSSQPARFVRENGTLTGVVTDQGETVSCRVLGVAIGYHRNVDLLAGSKIDRDQGILVDDRLRTSARDIYAAGDVAQSPDATYRDRRVHYGWLRAWEQGRIAGTNMAGGSATYADSLWSMHIQIYGLDFLALGISNPPPGGELGKEIGYFPEVGVYKSITRRNGTIVGATLLGNVDEAGRLEAMIRSNASLTDLGEELRRQMFDQFTVRTSAIGVLCPVCKLAIPLPESAQEGQVLTCPICGVDLRLERMANKLLAGRPL